MPPPLPSRLPLPPRHPSTPLPPLPLQPCLASYHSSSQPRTACSRPSERHHRPERPQGGGALTISGLRWQVLGSANPTTSSSHRRWRSHRWAMSDIMCMLLIFVVFYLLIRHRHFIAAAANNHPLPHLPLQVPLPLPCSRLVVSLDDYILLQIGPGEGGDTSRGRVRVHETMEHDPCMVAKYL